MERLLGTLVTLLAIAKGVSGIGCFVCSSFNNSHPYCEDPYNSTYDMTDGTMRTYEKTEDPRLANYHHPCWAFKKDRNGLFPADHCIKIKGHKVDDQSQTMIIRTCALDSGTLTADTEIVRISHCGHFKYEGHHYSGCVQSCDTDGCNSSRTISATTSIFLALIASMFRP